jgi:Tfp pilus assembly pilus retraction ATPase PilT/CheY-like chemotaxis protein
MKPKILIIDDEKETRELFVQFLEGEDYDIYQAENGQEAFNLAGTEKFDLYVTDVFMPEMNGIEFLKVLKTFDPDAVVIVITGFDKKEFLDQALEQGAFRFLTKPIKFADFRSTVAQGILERKKLYHSDIAEKLHRLKDKLAIDFELQEKMYNRFRDFLFRMESIKPGYIEIGGPGSKDRIWGKFLTQFKPIDLDTRFTQDEIQIMVVSILNDFELDILIKKKSVKTNFEIRENNSIYRYRLLIYFDMDELVIGIKTTRRSLINLEQMKFSDFVVNKMTFKNNNSGLVIISGPPSSGKSSLIDAIVDLNNTYLPGNIFVISDSLEYYHESKKSIIRQQKLHHDVVSLPDALKRCLDYQPNLVVFEDISSPEILENALKLVDSGSLVIATMKVKSVMEAVFRLLSFYPPESHEMARGRLARTLAVIVCLQLLPTSQNQMIPIKEILINDKQITQMFHSGNLGELYSVIQQGRKTGSQTMEQDLYDKFKQGLISPEAAVKAANQPGVLKEMLRYVK